MTTYNVHHREIDAPAAQVGSLIDRLATTQDPLWPQDRWPAMRFDRPGITVGGVGGHGPVGYRVRHHEPGRSVTFEFTNRPTGLHGRHQFVVQATGPHTCVLWHLTAAELRAPTRWLWGVFWAPLHDALIEDALTRAQAACGSTGVVTPWSRYVRVLRRLARAAGVRRHPSVGPDGTEHATGLRAVL